MGGTGARERILRAAAELFAERGYTTVSVREVCEAAGVSKPTLYYYFGSKAGLANALLSEAAGDFLGDVRRIAQGGGDVRGRLKAIARSVFERSAAAPTACRFFYACLFAPPQEGVEYDFEHTIPELLGMTAAVFEEGRAAGVVAQEYEAEFCAMVLLGALQGYTIRFLRRSDVRLTSDLADDLVEAVLKGLAPHGTEEGER